MQVLETIDVEDALREDLAELLGPGVDVHASPAPHDLKPQSVAIRQLGGIGNTPVSSIYDVAIDVWGATAGKALTLARHVAWAVSALPMSKLSSKRDWKTADARVPYANPDPNRPRMPRYSFNAQVCIRGTLPKQPKEK